MSIGPRKQLVFLLLFFPTPFSVLNVEQFERFMAVIRKLGDRVAKEHNQFLRDAQRLEDRSANAVNGVASTVAAGAVDFESLVGQADGTTIKADSAADPNWDDDPWGSILAAPAADVSEALGDGPVLITAQTPRIRSPAPMSGLPNPASPALASVASQLGVSSQPLSMRTGSSSSLVPPTKRSVVVPAPSPMALASSAQPAFQSFPPSMGSSTPAQAAPMGSFSPANLAMNASAPSTPALGPNYNISLQPMTPSAPAHSPSMIPPAPFFAAQPAMGGLLAPSKPPTSAWGAAPKKPTKDDWADFDPLG
jgi:SCY1-like protein 2